MIFLTLIFSLSVTPLYAVLASQTALQSCLKKAGDAPDFAVANAEAWEKRGGGEAARFCRATALSNAGEHVEAAKEFARLANLHDKNDPQQAAGLHVQSGLDFTEAHDDKNAETQFFVALRLEPKDAAIWLNRATERASFERYWDAIGDLNHALALDPNKAEALRLRGQAWVKLGNMKNAEADFIQADQIEMNDAEKKRP